MNYKWNYVPASNEQQEESRELANELGISPILGKFLLDRNIRSVSEAKRFSDHNCPTFTTRSCTPTWMLP